MRSVINKEFFVSSLHVETVSKANSVLELAAGVVVLLLTCFTLSSTLLLSVNDEEVMGVCWLWAVVVAEHSLRSGVQCTL